MKFNKMSVHRFKNCRLVYKPPLRVRWLVENSQICVHPRVYLYSRSMSKYNISSQTQPIQNQISMDIRMCGRTELRMRSEIKSRLGLSI